MHILKCLSNLNRTYVLRMDYADLGDLFRIRYVLITDNVPSFILNYTEMMVPQKYFSKSKL